MVNSKWGIQLLAAIESGDLGKMGEALDNEPPCVNKTRNDDDQTPLMVAADRGNLASVRLLIARGANVNAKDYEDNTPLMMAAYGDEDIAKALIDAGADVKKRNPCSFPLRNAAQSGRKGTVDALLAKGADVTKRDDGDCTALMHAALENHADIVKAIIDHIVQNNPDFAARRRVLKRAGTEDALNFRNAQEKPWAALLTEALQACAPQAKKKVSAAPKKAVGTSLMHAIEFDSTEAVLALITAGANVNERNALQETPLMLAMEIDDPKVTRALLAAGADINLRDKNGETALQHGVQGRNGPSLRVFVGAVSAKYPDDAAFKQALIEAGIEQAMVADRSWTDILPRAFNGERPAQTTQTSHTEDIQERRGNTEQGGGRGGGF